MRTKKTKKVKKTGQTVDFLANIFIFIMVVVFISTLYKGLAKVTYSTHCWEDPIEGVNTETGRDAYFSTNIDCNLFQANE